MWGTRPAGAPGAGFAPGAFDISPILSALSFFIKILASPPKSPFRKFRFSIS